MTTPWNTWCVGELAKLRGSNQVAVEALWAWSCAETWNGFGDPQSQLMRWCNPLNSTLRWTGSVDSPAQPSRPVQIYASVQDGIDATFATLTDPTVGLPPNGYDVICANLRSALPYPQWQNAGHQLGEWGTGIGWLSRTFPPAPQLLTATNTTSEDSNMAILAHPTQPRWDVFVVDKNGQIWHGWGTSNQLAAYQSAPSQETWAAPGAAAGGTVAPGTLSAGWSPIGRLIVTAAHPDGSLFMRELDSDFKLVADWRPVMVDANRQALVAVPVGLPGKDGGPGTALPPPPDDDSSYASATHEHTIGPFKTGPASD